MNHKCVQCGQKFTVHILDPYSLNKNNYCPDCKLTTQNSNKTYCYLCGLDFDTFLKRGYLGCQSCYDSFSTRLNPLITNYQKTLPIKKPHIYEYVVSKIAIARTLEAQEFINNKQSSFTQEPRKSYQEKQRKNTSSHSTIGFRIRLARNINNLLYLESMGQEQKQLLLQFLYSKRSTLHLSLSEHFLKEPYSLHNGSQWIGIALPDINLVMYGNDEDHIRIEWKKYITFDKLNSKEFIQQQATIYSYLKKVDSFFDYQYQAEYGFLTACPAVSGSGIRMSFQLHLPLLLQLLPQWVDNLTDSGFEIRNPGQESYTGGKMIEISHKHLPYDVNLELAYNRLKAVTLRLLKREEKLIKK